MEILLIGAGNMGFAMLKGLQNYDITVVEKNKNRIDFLKKEFNNLKVLNDIPKIDNKIVILAIKPQSLDSLKIEGNAKALISILAGTKISKLKEKISSKYYIRAMPNIAAVNLKSVTSLTGDLEFKDKAMQILSTIGKAIWLNSEKELDIATALGGSAPAWLAIVAEALADGAVNMGLSRDKSYEYLGALFEGVGSVLQNTAPSKFKDMVSSPGGTTIAGIEVLEDYKIRAAFIKAIRASYEKTKKID